MPEMKLNIEPHHESVLVFAPIGQDAALLKKVLEREGIACEISSAADLLFQRLEDECGAILLAEEALTGEFIERMNGILGNQEAWSDIPLVVMTTGGETTLTSRRMVKSFSPSGNISLLERPFRQITLVSSMQVALRSRRRQYQVRSLLKRQMEATRMRDEFISIASHELKTPLTSLKLQAQLNRRMINADRPESYAPARIDKLVESTEKQVDRLVRLVEDMLDISRIATGKMAMERTVVDLGELVNEVVERLRAQIEAAGCQIHLEVQAEVQGRWDRFRIEQVISNLLMNAIRYSPGTPLWIKLRSSESLAELTVRDKGPGIAKENQERIFQRFERAVNARNITGLGLGLFICREIVESHGGKISVVSELTQGACFIVELPILSESRPA